MRKALAEGQRIPRLSEEIIQNAGKWGDMVKETEGVPASVWLGGKRKFQSLELSPLVLKIFPLRINLDLRGPSCTPKNN